MGSVKPEKPANLYREPDLKKYNPDPDYIRWVLKQKKLSIAEACRRTGIPRSTMNDKLDKKLSTCVSYSEQYLLENL